MANAKIGAVANTIDSLHTETRNRTGCNRISPKFYNLAMPLLTFYTYKAISSLRWFTCDRATAIVIMQGLSSYALWSFLYSDLWPTGKVKIGAGDIANFFPHPYDHRCPNHQRVEKL
jgi:hypothetical protein